MVEDIKSNFENLVVWQKSCDLAKDIILCTKKFSQQDQFNFGGQLSRAAFSVPSNIAEGNERGSKKEFLYFLGVSIGSLAELRTQIHILTTAYIIDKKESVLFLEKITEIHKMLNGLKRSIKQKL